jgi:hypothetical protein
MIERPIIFSAPMIKAILSGRKTQTRRIANDRYRKISHLWVKETTAIDGSRVWYRADCDEGPANEVCEYPDGTAFEGKWRPSIFMPRWASRITLEIINVRVEQLQEISEEDAMAEGVTSNPYYMADGSIDEMMSIPAVLNFSMLWDSINGKRGYGWDTNPLVSVIEFKVIQKEEE